MYARIESHEWEQRKLERGETLWGEMDDESAVPPLSNDSKPTIVKVPDFSRTQTRGSLSQQSEPQSRSTCNSSQSSNLIQKEQESLLLELAKRSDQNITTLQSQLQLLQQELNVLKSSKPSAGHPEVETMKKSVSSSKAEDSSKVNDQQKSKLVEQSKTSNATTPKPKLPDGPKGSKKKE